MNPDELFEKELCRRRPAALPERFKTRLFAARPFDQVTAARQTKTPAMREWAWFSFLRWAVPATALIVAGFLAWRFAVPHGTNPVLKPDDVQITEQLVSSFDAVAKLPTGEPVRFRYQKWVDDVVMKDRKRGVVIEQRSPRVEVIPVGFDTY